jgi:serine/threonine protein kinase
MAVQGTTLGGRYRVDTLIASGGMADVFRGTDVAGGGTVAVKVLRHLGPEQASRFAVEARTLERLDHPAIVRFCASGEEDGTPYLVMEYVEGSTLAEVLARGPLTLDRVVAMGRRLAEALAHAHHVGIVHRDVKPGNVLLADDGSARLADFGIARLADSPTLTRTGMLVGTASYLAPEQLEGRRVGPRTDVYSLGLVLLEASTGRRAYDGPATEAAMARLVRPPEIPEELPAWWAALIRDMTAPAPDGRPSAEEVVARLGAAASAGETAVLRVADGATVTTTLEVPAVPGTETAPRRIGRRSPTPAVVAAVAAAVVAVLLLVGFAAAGGGDGGGEPEPRPEIPAELRDVLDRLEQEVGS